MGRKESNQTKAAAGGSLFQSGIVLGKKLYLKQSLDVEYCLYLYLCADLVLELSVSGSMWVVYQSVCAQFCREQSAAVCFFLVHATPNRVSQAYSCFCICLWQIVQIFSGPFQPGVSGHVGMDSRL